MTDFNTFDSAQPAAARFSVTYLVAGTTGSNTVELPGGADAANFLEQIGKGSGRYTVNVRRRTNVPASTDAAGNVTPASQTTAINNNVESTFVLQAGDQIIVSPSKIAGASFTDADFDTLA